MVVGCGWLWHTWFDRDLDASGHVFLRDGETDKIRQVRTVFSLDGMNCDTTAHSQSSHSSPNCHGS